MGQRVAASVGMFDGVHRGHRFLLDFLKSKSRGENRAMVFTFANHPLETIRRADAPPRLSTAGEKIKLLSDCGVEVVMLSFDNSLRSLSSRQFLEKIRDQYSVESLVIGFNNHFGNDRGLSLDDYSEIGRQSGVEIIGAPEYSGAKVSSSIIRGLLGEGKIAEATDLLGHRYTLGGKVVSGKQLGRTIGFPTANIEPEDKGKLIPLTGVYAVDVTIDNDNEKHRGILNIGNRPTVDHNGARSVEVHIDGFEGDIYGHNLNLEFLARLRDELRFPDLSALSAQLYHDREAARKL